ncbi:hypothetical protein ILUMI_14470, partial [Ignelater luminosus]
MTVHLFVTFFVLCVFYTDIVKSKCDIKGYYWRDYNYKIPSDAFLVKVGYPRFVEFYIAQVLNSGILMPVSFDSSNSDRENVK